MKFQEAILAMEQGKRVTREDWNGRAQLFSDDVGGIPRSTTMHQTSEVVKLPYRVYFPLIIDGIDTKTWVDLTIPDILAEDWKTF